MARSRGPLYVSIDGSAKPYYDQAKRDFRDARWCEVVSNLDKCKSLLGRHAKDSYVVDDMRVKAYMEMGREDFIRNKDSAWVRVAITNVNDMIKKYGRDSYKPYFRKVSIYRIVGLKPRVLAMLEDVINHATFPTAPPEIREETLAHRAEVKAQIKKLVLLQEWRDEMTAIAKDLGEEMRWKETTNFEHVLSPDLLFMVAQAGREMYPGFVIRMAGVCHRWRDVVYNQPSLWNRLTLGAKNPVKKAAFWLQRSGGYIRELNLTEQLDSHHQQSIAEMLEDVVEKVERFTIRSNHGTTPALWNDRFKRLKRLEIIYKAPAYGGRHISGGIAADLVHPDCHELRKVYLEHVMITGIAQDGKPLEWFQSPEQAERLKVVELRDCDLHDLDSTILKSLRNARSLDLTSSMWRSGPRRRTSDSRAVELALEDFCAANVTFVPNYMDGDDTGFIADFSAFSSPNLIHLDLYNNFSNPLVRNLATSPFLSSKSTLVSLDIGKCPIPQQQLLTALLHFTSLEFLGVAYTGIDDKFLERLVIKEDDEETILLPKLKAISLAGNQITASPIRDFIMSRIPKDRKPPSQSTASAGIDKTKPTVKYGGAFRPSSSSSQQKAGSNPSQSSSSRSNSSSGLTKGIAIRKRSSQSAMSDLSRIIASVNTQPTQPSPTAVRKIASMTSTPTASRLVSSPSQTPPQMLSQTSSQQQLQSQSQTQPHFTQKPKIEMNKIEWLNIDHCESVNSQLQEILANHVRYISHWLGTLNEERIRGKGQYTWKGNWRESCVSGGNEPSGCYLKLVEGMGRREDRWRVWHICQKDEPVSVPDKEMKGWEKVEAGKRYPGFEGY